MDLLLDILFLIFILSSTNLLANCCFFAVSALQKKTSSFSRKLTDVVILEHKSAEDNLLDSRNFCYLSFFALTKEEIAVKNISMMTVDLRDAMKLPKLLFQFCVRSYQDFVRNFNVLCDFFLHNQLFIDLKIPRVTRESG